jgi:arylsulfatase A-like enzyme
MLEGGSRVPLAISWPGTTPAGKVCPDVTDFSDFFTTIANLAGAKLPEGVKLDGHSLVPQIHGEKGVPREWAYVELSGKHYVTSAHWKLTQAGELFDMKDAPYKELAVPSDSTDPEAIAARKQLQAALDQLLGQPEQPKDKTGKAGKLGKKGKKAGKNAVPETPAPPDAPKETTPPNPSVEK